MCIDDKQDRLTVAHITVYDPFIFPSNHLGFQGLDDQEVITVDL